MKNEMSLEGYGVEELTLTDEQNYDGGFLIWTPSDFVGNFNRIMNGLAGLSDGFLNGHDKIKQ